MQTHAENMGTFVEYCLMLVLNILPNNLSDPVWRCPKQIPPVMNTKFDGVKYKGNT
uniref:Uncharacterized protein n=1 Tax=Arundo donax TaxID=35708 RepID=A0A0A9GW37_ARUDO